MSFLQRMYSLWYPDRFQGWGRDRNYFEGWYFKVVAPDEGKVLAFIPGISMDPQGTQHAFIQVLDGIKCEAAYHRFPAESFRPAADRFALELGGNFFSSERLRIDLPTMKGELQFSKLVPWPKFLYAPGIMGWFSFVPFMECYHGIVSMNHRIGGGLRIGQEYFSFDGGKGYTEKDWGRSFPNAWIWFQTNHFDLDEPLSVVASVAHIPWLGSHFIGYIVGLWWRGKVYRFATYTGAMMQAALDDQKVLLNFKDRRYRLQIKAEKGGAGTGELVSPISGEMTGKVDESIQAVSFIELYENNELVLTAKGRNGGLEVAGNVDALLTSAWRR